MWENINLGEVCEFINGGSWSDSEYRSEGIPVIKVTNMVNGSIDFSQLDRIPESSKKKYEKNLLKFNDLVIATVGSHPNQPNSVVGRTSIIPINGDGYLLNQNALCIRVKQPEILDSKFLNFITKTVSFSHFASSRARGSANQVRLAISELRNFQFKAPPLPIQQKIASILSAYDELIENNKQRIKLLEEMAEEIYKEWFVRLRFPNYENTEFVDGLPLGWEKVKLKKYLKFYRGKSYSSEELRNNEGLPMLNLKNINRGGGFRRDGLKFFEGKYSSNNLALSGDLILAITDMTQNRELVGRIARVPEMNIDKFIFSMDLIKIEPLFFPKNFLYAFLRYSGIGLKFAEYANGANVLHLTPDLIYHQSAIFPTLFLANNFEKIVNPFLNEIDVLENKNQLLQQTRDLLLPRLISGKLSVAGLLEDKVYKMGENEERLSMAAEDGV